MEGTQYGRTVALEGCRGVIFVQPDPEAPQVNVDLSVSLLPALMPLLARLRHLLDLDAEPALIDAHLEQEGLADLVAQRPGLRLPGAFDGFEVAARELLGTDLIGRVTQELGEPFDTGIESLDRLGLTPYRVAEAGRFMTHLGVPARRAEALASLARGGGRRRAATGTGKRSTSHAGSTDPDPGHRCPQYHGDPDARAPLARCVLGRGSRAPTRGWRAEYGGAAPNS